MINIENRLSISKSYRVILVIAFCIALSAYTLVLFTTNRVFAESLDDGNGWSWTSSKPIVYSSEEATGVNPGSCSGSLQNFAIFGVIGNRMVCVKNNGTIRIGTYSEGNITYWVVSYPTDSLFYRISIPCSSDIECLYLPGSDSLVTKRYLINAYVKSLVIYKNVSKRIKLSAASTLQFRYDFDDSNPDYTFRSSSGYAWPVVGLGASDNGQWLAVELRERGIGLLNMNTLQMKRISSAAIRYGYGYDPTTELAVSNSGEQIVQMGMNSGFSFYDLSDGCGDIVNDAVMSVNYINSPCKQPNIDLGEFIRSFYAGLYPKFKNDGAELTFYAMSYVDKPHEVVLRASGFQPQRIDYLALGDSYSSGEGETDDSYYLNGTNTEFEKCHVSARSYPFIAARISDIQSDYVRSVACSGATTGDVIGDNMDYLGQVDRLGSNGMKLNKGEANLAKTYARYNFLPGRITQEIFASWYEPKVITIGIGGNDIDLVGKLKSCIGFDTCDIVSNPDRRAQVANEIKSFYPKLVETYKKLHSDSPSSKIFAIGYPRMIQEDGNCDIALGKLLDYDEREFMNEAILYLNQVTEAAAKTAGIKYVENYNTFGDQVLCGADDPKAANGIRQGDDASLTEGFGNIKVIGNESFHPNPAGFEMIADNIIMKVGDLNFAKVCDDDRIICPVETLPPEPSAYWGVVLASNENLPKMQPREFIDSIEASSELIIRHIKLGEYTFLPNSQVEISVYSDKQSLGVFNADENGALSVAVQLPADLEEGYHTVHIVGSSYSGESIDIYQVIGYWHSNFEPKGNSTELSSGALVDTIQNNISNDKIFATSQAKVQEASDESITNNNSQEPVGIGKEKKSEVKGAEDYQSVNKVSKNTIYTYIFCFIGIGALIAVFVLVRKANRWFRNQG